MLQVFQHLSKRERAVLDLLYANGPSTAVELYEKFPDPPSFSAVRAVIRTLEEKGHITHQEAGLRYVYLPVIPVEKAKDSALAHLLSTFFGNSPSRLLATVLDQSSRSLPPEELERLEALIQSARRSPKSKGGK